jgi:hypothetical protein
MAQGGMVCFFRHLEVTQRWRRSSFRSSWGKPEVQKKRESCDAADTRKPERCKPQKALGERLRRRSVGHQ